MIINLKNQILFIDSLLCNLTSLSSLFLSVFHRSCKLWTVAVDGVIVCVGETQEAHVSQAHDGSDPFTEGYKPFHSVDVDNSV
jgi:hypothetical protein